MPTYSLKRFELPASRVGRGNWVADVIATFFSINPTLTIVDVSTNWREGRSRSDTLYLTLAYRGGGTPGRMWAAQFQSLPDTTAETLATQFYAMNPSYVPIKTVALSRPDVQPRNRRLLSIFATRQNAQAPCSVITPAGAPPANLAVAAYGVMYDPLDLTRPALPALNLGNATWPVGRANLLIRAVDANPDLCAWGGIAPCCYVGAAFATTTPPVPDLLCGGCIPADLITISTTGP